MRRSTIIAASVLLGLSSTSAAQVVRHTPLERLPVVFASVAGNTTHVNVSEVTRRLDEALRREANVSVQIEPPDKIEGCRGNAACLSSRFADRWVLIVSISSAGAKTDRISAVLVDTTKERIVHRTTITTIDSEHQIDAWVTALTQDVAARVVTMAYGALRVLLPEPGATVVLGDQQPTVATSTAIELEFVEAGAHPLRVDLANGERYEVTATVRRGATSQVIVPRIAARRGLTSPTVIGATAVAVVGLALTTWSVAYSAANDAQGARCIGAAACPRFNTWTIEQMLDGAPSGVDSGRIPAIALGAGITAAGLTTGLTALLFERSSGSPWWQIAAGLVAGAMFYGVATLVATR